MEQTIWQLIVPRKMISQVLSQSHDVPLGGHFGINKTLSKIRQQFYWAYCKSDVEEWCRKCPVCFSKKGPRTKTKGELQVYNVGCPFERIALDILAPLPKSSSGNKYLLVISDYFTSWPEAFPLPNFQAKTVAETLVSEVISRFGIPHEIHSDQGRNFESNVFRETMTILGIGKTRTTPLHPQSNGLVERLNRTILQYLSKFVNDNQKDWDRWIPLFLLAYRSSKHETTEFTPAMMVMGRELKLPLELLRGNPPQGNELHKKVPEFVEDLKEKLISVHEDVRKRFILKSDKIKSKFDLKSHMISFKIGQRVWLYYPHKVRGKCPKLQRDWEGPYFIKSKINDVVYRIQKFAHRKYKVVHINRLAPYDE